MCVCLYLSTGKGSTRRPPETIHNRNFCPVNGRHVLTGCIKNSRQWKRINRRRMSLTDDRRKEESESKKKGWIKICSKFVKKICVLNNNVIIRESYVSVFVIERG